MHSNEISQDLFIRLLISNRNRIFRYILTMVPNWSDAEDLLQNTCSVMWKKIDQYQMDRDFVTWGCGIARYEILMYLREQRNNHLLFNEKLIEQLEQNTRQLNDLTEDLMKNINHCVERLQQTDRELVKMRYEEDLSVREMSMRIGRSGRAIYKSLSRIHDWLLQCIERKMA